MELSSPKPENNELKDLLEEDLELNKENNEMLKSMVRTARWSLVFSVAKWVLIIGSLFGVYYYFGQLIGPLIDQYKALLGPASDPASGASILEGKLEQLKAIIKVN